MMPSLSVPKLCYIDWRSALWFGSWTINSQEPASFVLRTQCSRACLAVRLTVKNGDPPEHGKIWENGDHLIQDHNWNIRSKVSRQMPGGNFWSDKCQESIFGRTNARRTILWQFDCQFHILSIWHFPNLTSWNFYILTIWQFYMVDNCTLWTIWIFWQFENLKILHLKFYIWNLTI